MEIQDLGSAATSFFPMPIVDLTQHSKGQLKNDNNNIYSISCFVYLEYKNNF